MNELTFWFSLLLKAESILALSRHGSETDPLSSLPPIGSISAGRVIIEVGLDGRPGYFNQLLDDESLLLIGVEPLSPRGVALPQHPRFFTSLAAVGNVPYAPNIPPALATMHRTALPGCSSLLSPERGHAQHRNCTKVLSRVRVPVVPLLPLLERALSFGPVELIEVDVQGTEIDVLESGAGLLSGVQRVVMEIQDVHRAGILTYDGQVMKQEVIERMGTLGFRKERCWDITSQENCAFVQASAPFFFRDDCWDVQALGHLMAEMETNTGLKLEGGYNGREFETFCCKPESYALPICWDMVDFTPQRCCLREYLSLNKLAYS